MIKKLILTPSDIHVGHLVLVNKDYPINSQLNTNNLVSHSHDECMLLDKLVMCKLQKVLERIDKHGELVLVSGYRSHKEQTELYNDSIKDNGLEFTKKYVALPNHSEHELGYAIDLGLTKNEFDIIRPSFPNTGVSEVFRNLSVDDGFIERYKKDKEHLTHISAEQWHFRYVGYPHSKIMHEYNLCLEEYIELLKQYPRGQNPFIFESYEISYVPLSTKTLDIQLKDHETVSGNNVDGFIFTRNLYE